MGHWTALHEKVCMLTFLLTDLHMQDNKNELHIYFLHVCFNLLTNDMLWVTPVLDCHNKQT